MRKIYACGVSNPCFFEENANENWKEIFDEILMHIVYTKLLILSLLIGLCVNVEFLRNIWFYIILLILF